MILALIKVIKKRIPPFTLMSRRGTAEEKNYKTKKKGRNSNIYYNIMTNDKDLEVGNKID